MVGDLFVDLRSGHNLISLLELLTQERLVSLSRPPIAGPDLSV